ncbi:porin [uncultured Gimesia sp.]|uniref:porin n=1 Tax=uncultured Gimesia sp. TaxID=1678688 RepID=UPI002637C993|nr:porin [uncultured Gimesia sp.]
MQKLNKITRQARMTGLLLSGLGLMAISPAFGGDAACAPSCTPDKPNACCTKVFEEAGDKLAAELDRLTAECCAPKSCDTGCTDPNTCCGEASSDDEDCCFKLSSVFDKCDGSNHLTDNGWKLSGWLEFGMTFNGNRPANDLNTPGVGFNQADSQFMMNQLYFVLEKDAAANEDCFGWGGRVDMVVGSDAQDTSTFGGPNGNPNFDGVWTSNNTATANQIGLAMPQMYASFYAPIGNGVTLNVGHFYTTIGYEVVPAPDNFFYSHAYTMQFNEPFTHTGALASTDLNDNVALTGGITTGWDDFENQNNKWSFLGLISWTSDSEDTSVAFSLSTGAENDAFGGTSDLTVFSIVAQQKLSDKMSYVFQHDHMFFRNGDVADPGQDAETYGINQYLYYDMCDSTRAGMRVEWWRDHNGTQLGTAGANYYEVTAGLNYKWNSCLRIRPEVRWDWSDNASPWTNSSGAAKNSQFTVGTDVILTF